MTDTRPTHLLVTAKSGKLVAVCGAKGKDSGPRVAVEHAQAHIEGRGMVPCSECVLGLDVPEQLQLEVAR